MSTANWIDLAKVESNTIKIEISELSIAELCESMRQNFDPVATGEGLGFSVVLDEQLPAAMMTDPHRLRQVLKNLLSNAFKLTDNGEVTMRLRLAAGGWNPDNERLTAARGVLAVSIADTGIGIKEDLQKTVFEAFAQADGTAAREYGGTGLGLSISRNLVHLLGGEMALTSQPEVGSTFTVFLPLEPISGSSAAAPPAAGGSQNGNMAGPGSRGDLAEPPPAEAVLAPSNGSSGNLRSDPALEQLLAAATSSPAETPKGSAESSNWRSYAAVTRGMTVLLVDDDFRNIFAMTALLERANANVLSAQSGMEALAILDQTDVDIVLMDIMMPVMNGYETITQIRRNPRLAKLPIVAVTGKVVSGERARCLAAGASDYIPKPIDTGELLSALRNWFPAVPRVDGAP